MRVLQGREQEGRGEHPVALQVEPVAFPQGKHREDLEYLEAVEGTLSEWLSEADEGAYREL